MYIPPLLPPPFLLHHHHLHHLSAHNSARFASPSVSFLSFHTPSSTVSHPLPPLSPLPVVINRLNPVLVPPPFHSPPLLVVALSARRSHQTHPRQSAPPSAVSLPPVLLFFPQRVLPQTLLVLLGLVFVLPPALTEMLHPSSVIFPH